MVWFLFQMVFHGHGSSPSVTGSVAERWKYAAFCVVVGLSSAD
jgi:ammonia channel protein AmtB